MQLSGYAARMLTSLTSGVAQYSLNFNETELDVGALVGKPIELKFSQQIRCASCGRMTNKSYSQGYCWPCANSLARCDLCIMRPETCHHHKGTCREPEWGESYCFSPHIVYIANTSGIKVGITRKTNMPSRWIDQGAISALPILEVETRLDSGRIETALKSFVSDKTNWRKMLMNEVAPADLVASKAMLLGEIPSLTSELRARPLSDDVINIDYPVIKYPTKVVSLNFDKTPVISGVLNGVKGQYLLLDCGVLNIRKFSSYHLTIST
mgnify:FL=1